MSDGYQHVHALAVEAIEAAVKDFAKWLARNWNIPADRALWEKQNADPYPGDDYVKGYNGAMEAAPDAVEVYLEEHLP